MNEYLSVHCSPITGKKFSIGMLPGSECLLLIREQLIGKLIWSNGGIVLTTKLEIPGEKCGATHHNH